MQDPSKLSADQIKLGGGLSGAVVSNLFGIPVDQFRVRVAQDLTSRPRPQRPTLP